MARKKKPEQTELPGEGYSRKVDPKIEAAEKALTAARTAKTEAKSDEDQAAEQLVAAMRAAGVDTYSFVDAENLRVTINLKASKVKITVKRKKPAAADEAN